MADRDDAAREFSRGSTREQLGQEPQRTDEHAPQREWGHGYGGGYGRSGDYGEAGGHGRWLGQEAGAPSGGGRHAPPDYRGLGPRDYRRSAARIFEDVCESLTRSPDVDASDVEVEVGDGEVILRGTVRTRWEKRHAEELAEAIAGVRDVHNRLRLASQGPAGAPAEGAGGHERDGGSGG